MFTFSEVIVFICVSHQHQDEGEDSHQAGKCEELHILQSTKLPTIYWTAITLLYFKYLRQVESRKDLNDSHRNEITECIRHQVQSL